MTGTTMTARSPDPSKAIELDPEGFAGLLQSRPTFRAKGEMDRALDGLQPGDQARSRRTRSRSTTAPGGPRDKGEPERAIADFSDLDPARRPQCAGSSTTAASPIRTAANTIARCGFRAGDPDRPGYAPAFFSRGLALFERRDYDRSILDLNQAINGPSQLSGGLQHPRHGLLRQGRSRPRHPGLRPGHPAGRQVRWAFNNRGEAFQGKRDLDRAIADFDDAIKANPNFDVAYYNRGLGIATSATSSARSPTSGTPLRLDPRNAPGVQESRFRLLEQGRRTKGDRRLRAAIKLDSKFAGAYSNRGSSHYDRRDYDRAIADFDHAVRLNPGMAGRVARSGLGVSR